MNLSVKLQGNEKLKGALGTLGDRAAESLASALYVEAELVMTDSKRLVDVDQGTLKSSAFVKPPQINRNALDWSIEVEMGYGGAASGYAIFLHEGTGPNVGQPPFMPPVEPFKEWARRVLGDESLGFVIARAVGARGLGPRKFLERPLMQKAATMGERIAARLRRDLERR